MTKDMQTFLKIGRALPPKRAANVRLKDYDEIFHTYDRVTGKAQASRCEQCGNPGCEYLCPLGNHIVDWLRLASQGNILEAAKISQSTNTFPEICGRICPQDKLCEKNCILNIIEEGAVTIGAIEAWINDEAAKQGFSYQPKRAASTGLKVAVVGSGPAGLACAEQLNLLGHEVAVFERASQAGGLMIFGIPNFKLDKRIVQRQVKRLKQVGIRIVLNTTVGKDVSYEDLTAQGYEAVFLAFGAYDARPLGIPGKTSHLVHAALPYLIQTNEMNLGLPFEKQAEITIVGKDVVVLGGGDTAMDCVRTSVRKGARSVTCLYRRDRANMPGSQKEVNHAMEEGVRFEFLADAVGIEEQADSAILKVQRMRLGARDRSGRQPIEKIDEFFELPADVVLVAYGYDVERLPFLHQLGIKTHADGRIAVDANGMTSIAGIFAGGDAVRGASLVVWGIRDGRDVAVGIHRYLSEKHARKTGTYGG